MEANLSICFFCFSIHFLQPSLDETPSHQLLYDLVHSLFVRRVLGHSQSNLKGYIALLGHMQVTLAILVGVLGRYQVPEMNIENNYMFLCQYYTYLRAASLFMNA